MRAGVALSEHGQTEAAIDEIGRDLFARGLLEEVSAALIWATPHHAPRVDALRRGLTARLGTRKLAGCIASGVIGGDREVTQGPGLSVMVFSDEDPQRFSTRLMPNLSVQPEEIGRDLVHGTDLDDLLFVMATPRFLQLPPLLAGLARGEGCVIGGGASNPSGPDVVFTGEGASGDAIAALKIEGCRPLVELTHSCRPISPLMAVTASEGRLVTHLGHRPAVAVLSQLLKEARAQGARDSAIFVGLTHGLRGREVVRGEYRVRPILGVAPGGRGLILSEAPGPGAGLVFLTMGTAAARQDLNLMLMELGERLDQAPDFALIANCAGRGEGFQGIPDFDASVIGAYLPKVPLGGFFGSFELGPLRGQAALHMYTAVLGLGLG